MKYIMDLTNEDIKYICTVIPYQETAAYFRKNPKEFTKIRPGFRVKSLNDDMLTRILYEFRAKDFISSYLNKHIVNWIKDIDSELIKVKEQGLDQNAAYIDVLSRSFFAGNVALFFKIKEEEKTEEYISVLSSAVTYEVEHHKEDEEELISINKIVKQLKEKKEDIEQQLADEKKKTDYLMNREQEFRAQLEQKSLSLEEANEEKKESEEKCKHLKDIAEKLEADLIKTKNDEAKKSSEMQKKIDTLTQEVKEQSEQVEEYSATISELEDKLISADEDVKTWRNQVRIRENQIFTYKSEKATLLTEKDNDKKQIKELKEALELALSAEKTQNTEDDKNGAQDEQSNLETGEKVVPRRYSDCEWHTLMQPENMEDFDEYFGYNLENIGLNQNEEASMDFSRYLQDVIFNGVPLLIKRGPGINIANSLSNTLYGAPVAACLSYTEVPDVQKVDEYLTKIPDRVICIDGFIGNCNALELIPVLEQHRNKIIILTYMFDRTLTFVPNEILSYVHFISADMFSSLLRIKDITEDPSEIKEVPICNVGSKNADTRLQKIFRDIAYECGVELSTASAMADMIVDETHLNNMLIFTLLPYVQKVLGKNPYNCSKRLQRYAGDSGRCIKKEMIMRWFG